MRVIRKRIKEAQDRKKKGGGVMQITKKGL
jgi:hypothetical protein